LASLQFHGVQLQVSFEELKNCVQVSGDNIAVVKCKNGQGPLVDSDLSAKLLTTYVYLDLQERDRFATGEIDQLVDQVQWYSTVSTTSQARIMLSFNHPLIELIWCVRRKEMSASNNWFNYSGKWGRDPISQVSLRLNNSNRFSQREGRYFRLVVPYECHTCIPESYVYCFSFALFPEDANPSGSCNASRIDNIELILDFQAELFDTANDAPKPELAITVFARSLNILRFRDGLSGLVYAS
jgi:hypothetical protein